MQALACGTAAQVRARTSAVNGMMDIATKAIPIISEIDGTG